MPTKTRRATKRTKAGTNGKAKTNGHATNGHSANGRATEADVRAAKARFERALKRLIGYNGKQFQKPFSLSTLESVALTTKLFGQSLFDEWDGVAFLISEESRDAYLKAADDLQEWAATVRDEVRWAVAFCKGFDYAKERE